MIVLLALVLVVIVLGIYQVYVLVRIQRQMTSLYSKLRERSVKEKSAPAAAAIPVPEEMPPDIDVLAGGGGMGRALQALVRKYSLGSITLATTDGLVVATSGGSDAETDAAHYSSALVRGVAPVEKEVTLFSVNYRGSPLVGIIRAQREISRSWMAGIKKDVVRILEAEL
ncbi:hypothetical protein J2741_001945 [Methanolinea mesophila]|uniref:hypothetical protein n=1 Tax=Methanolinea mesophila TaxID=547055 RepID=UPI001AE0FE9E|nr:hypothetical protein [Methanolinea mesophila]MBP1929398.1 hypothetical protein [Methanolinea mesophila]